ncbi:MULTISPECIES: acyltransferase family protein [Pseudomonas]|uniref:acyltransferase family protein n=1 Tax=Pseudomonas TaxID=286 RepID=UPI001BEA1BD9|nr:MULTISPECIES: acyltransferase family protein [Pseudomonas]MBT2342238.1 acyltransferase [Pseudomonas fluorescens]MCD4529013.1 acyltransferase [Pseudomonas sp. C3-2018]
MTSLAQQETLLPIHRLSHPKYRADIDGLRAIAVLSVVLFHALPSMVPGGFIGVDVFFVISGYLISTIIYGSLDDKVFSFREFYARRIKRIFPALLLVLLSCFAFGWFTLFADEFQQLGKHLAGGAVFISNILLWDESGYFDTSAEIKPLLHLWSLGIEEQFYIFWPVILWAIWKLRANILLVALIAAGLSFGWNITHVASDSVAVFYLPHTRVWELLIGSILAYFSLYRPSHPLQRPALRNISALLGIAALSYGFYAITSKTEFPGWWALIPALGTALIIAAGPEAWLNKQVLSFRPFVWIGLISFPLYLWHWPLLSFARIIESETPALEIRIAAVILAMLLAWATYQLCEKPLRKSNSKLKTPTLLLVMVVVGVMGYATFYNAGLPQRASVKSAEEFNSQFVGPIWKYAKNDTCINRYPFKEAATYGWWFCITNKDRAPDILLLGNSYTNHLFPGLAAAAETKDSSILSIGACPPDMIDITDPNATTDTNPCSGSRAYHQKLLINGIIENSGTIKYSIIDGLNKVVDDAYIKRIDERITHLEKHGIKVIVFIPHIVKKRELKGCYSRPLKTKAADCTLGLDAKKEIDEGFAPLITRISAVHPDVKFFDQNELFCGLFNCSLTLNGMPIFRDQYAHYSEYASSQVAKLFIQWAEINAPGILNK